VQNGVAGNSGVVDDNIERAEFLHGGIHHLLHGRAVRHGTQHVNGLAAFGLDLIHNIFRVCFVDVIHNDFRPFFGKAQNNAFSDAASGTCYNRYFVFQSHFHLLDNII